MAKTISPIVIATDTFSSWITRTNQLISALGSEVITANSSVDGANTTGNTNLIGIFGANTVAVGSALRGGTVNAAANLSVSSNVVFNGSNAAFSSNVVITNAVTVINAAAQFVNGPTLTVQSNTTINGNTSINGPQLTCGSNAVFTGTNTSIQSTSLTITGTNAIVNSNVFTIGGNTVNATANVTFNGRVTASNVFTFNANVSFGGYGTQTGVVNTNIGATANVLYAVASWDKASFKASDITARVGNSTHTRVSKILVASNGADAYMTEYAVLHSPTSANLGIYSLSTTTTDVVLSFTPTVGNLSMNLNINLTP